MNRVQSLLKLADLKADTGILIHKPSNIFYLSGYTGEGLLVLTRELRAIVTDFRYVEQAGNQAPGFAVHAVSNTVSHAQLAASLLKAAGAGSVLYEDDCLTVRDAGVYGKALDGISMHPLNNHPEALRQVKDGAEIALIEKACAISCEAFEYICGVIRPGMSEAEIKRLLEYRMLELGAEATAFDTIAASGPNGSLPHAIAGKRQVQTGEMLTLDFGARYGGYCADMTRTLSLGKPSAKMREIYGLVLSAQQTCQDALAPGKVCRDVDAIARKIIGDAGYGEYFGHGLGHAVGIDIHEDPRLSPKCDDVLKPGHVMTVEPGIYLPGVGGVRIENTCVITENGARSLVTASRELRIL